jgi:hypothetical protein
MITPVYKCGVSDYLIVMFGHYSQCYPQMIGEEEVVFFQGEKFSISTEKV